MLVSWFWVLLLLCICGFWWYLFRLVQVGSCVAHSLGGFAVFLGFLVSCGIGIILFW